MPDIKVVQQISIHWDSHQQQIEHRINTIVSLAKYLPFACTIVLCLFALVPGWGFSQYRPLGINLPFMCS
jgi:hypothetical protein